MVGGAAEPLYLPDRGTRTAELHYREDFAASALHEAAHWCIEVKHGVVALISVMNISHHRAVRQPKPLSLT